MAKIKDFKPGDNTKKLVRTPIGFRESKSRFGKIHEYLVKVGVIDGSSNSLIEDLLDTKVFGKEAVELILTSIKGIKSVHSKVEKLVYIALGGFYRVEISMRIRVYLDEHLREVKKAIAKKDFDYGRSLIKGPHTGLTEDEILKALGMRERAIVKVYGLKGEHFLKRVYHVSPGWKIPISEIRKGK